MIWIVKGMFSNSGEIVTSISSVPFVFFNSAFDRSACLPYIAFATVAFHQIDSFCFKLGECVFIRSEKLVNFASRFKTDLN